MFFVMLSHTVILPSGEGGTVTQQVSTHFDQGLILTPCSNLIKVTLVTCEKNVIHLDSTKVKHYGFSLGTRVSSCTNTGPTGWSLLDLLEKVP